MSLKSRNINPSAFQRGAASTENKFVPPSGTLSSLTALPRTAGAVFYVTDKQRLYYDDGLSLLEIQPAQTTEEFSIVSALIFG